MVEGGGWWWVVVAGGGGGIALRVLVVVGGGWWAVVVLPNAFTCFQMLPNESKVYHFDLILNALPVRMLIQVPKNSNSAAEGCIFQVPF